MLVFIDDSGDAGFKLDRGSSLFFVITCVIFEDNLEAEKTSVAIKEYKRECKFSDNTEFKFNGSSKNIRIGFFEKVDSFKFYIRSLVVDKRKIYSPELKNNKNSFYSYAIKQVLSHSNDEILDAKIKIDGSGDRTFKKNFISYLRRSLNTDHKRIMNNCRLINSKSNTLIQLADMIAGAVRRSYDIKKSDSAIYKAIFKKHVKDEWRFK